MDGSFLVILFLLMNLPAGFFKQRVELFFRHSAFPKTFANWRQDVSKGSLGENLGFNQRSKILLARSASMLSLSAPVGYPKSTEPNSSTKPPCAPLPFRCCAAVVSMVTRTRVLGSRSRG